MMYFMPPGRRSKRGWPLFMSTMALLGLACICSDSIADIGSALPWFGPTATEPTYWEVPTAAPTERVQPTRSPTATRRPSGPIPTRTPSVAGCWHWSEITMDDVGRDLCVYGIVQSGWWDSNQGAYFINFSSETGSYYIVLYGWRITDLESGDCVKSSGEIGHLGSSPVMTIDAYDLFHCY